MRKKTGGRQKGTPNKITSEIRDKISILVSGTIDSIDINLTVDILQEIEDIHLYDPNPCV